LKYVSIPAKKYLAQRENSSLPVTSPVFRYTLARIHTYQALDAIKIKTGNQTVQEIPDEICVL